MHIVTKSGLGLAAASALLVGSTAASQGESAPTATAAGNGTYQFVDKDLTNPHRIMTYDIPDVPPGAYTVNLYAQVSPVDLDLQDAYGCGVADVRPPANGSNVKSVVSNQFAYNGEFISAIEATATWRVTKASDLRVTCASERGAFTFTSPLQVSLTRLDGMLTAPLVVTHEVE
jgi:hypothetical protein